MITSELIAGLVARERSRLEDSMQILKHPDNLWRIQEPDRLLEAINQTQAEIDHCTKLLDDWLILGPKKS